MRTKISFHHYAEGIRNIALRSSALVLLLVCLLVRGAMAADSLLASIKREGVLRIGTTGDYRPYSFKGTSGELEGADVAMMRSLADMIGVKPIFVTTTWKSMMADFARGKFDVIAGGVTVDAARAELGKFSRSYISDGKRPIVRCADRDRYTDIETIDRPEVRVIVNPGGTNEQFAREKFGRSALHIFPDNATVFDQIVSGNADVMVTDGIEVDLQSNLHRGVLCPARVAQPFTHFEKAYLLRPDAEFKATVNAFLQKQLDSGAWAKHLQAAEQ